MTRAYELTPVYAGAVPDVSDRVRIGVRLGPPSDISSWLMDGASFDAAGAAALWLDLRSEPSVDPYVLTASLAAMTFRSLLVLELPPDDGSSDTSDRSARTLAAISRGRLVLAAHPTAAPAEDAAQEADAIPDRAAAAVEPAGLASTVRRVPGDPDTFEQLDEVSNVRRWEAADVPPDRAAWREVMAEAAGRDVHGLILPADPRLLDLLRNPDDEIDRRDLQLAAG